MNYQLPKTIENAVGEKIIFKEIVHEPDGDKVLIEGTCKPGAGPPMHVHFRQDEGFTVRAGTMGYQALGQGPVIVGPGESATFKRGTPHRFWNAGDTDMVIDGWVKPVNSIIFFLSALYAAQSKPRQARPDAFDAAYLMVRYRSEYRMLELPGVVRTVIMPIAYAIGRLTGKYRKFTDAPAPLK